MVDILFLAKGRKEFTEASLNALLDNTELGLDPSKDDSLSIYTDGDEHPEIAFRYALMTNAPIVRLDHMPGHGGPVACLNAFLDRTAAPHPEIPESYHRDTPSEFISKIDNDTIVPAGWLPACLDVMKRYPEVDLLGLEPWAPDEKLWPKWVEPNTKRGFHSWSEGHPESPDPQWPGGYARDYPGIRKVSHVGGIGVFRRSAFERFGKPTPNSTDGRYGFTEWQWANPSMVKAFLDPPLPVFLLDHLPFDPWLNLSFNYERIGEQRRQWGFYDPIKHKALWDWWLK